MVWVCPPPPLHTLLPLPAQPAGFGELRKDPPPGMGGCVRAGCLQFQPVAEAGGAQLGEKKGCDG